MPSSAVLCTPHAPQLVVAPRINHLIDPAAFAMFCSPHAPRLVVAARVVQLVDPAPFLSTIITASAGLVAIIGGLLVARFVSLDSDQRSSRKILSEARDRLEAARRRATDAHNSRLDWHAGYFFRGDVLQAVSMGASDPAALMQIDDDWPFTIQELQPYATEMANEFVRARSTLGDRGTAIDKFNGLRAWDDFRRATSDLPEIIWDRVWESVFDEIKIEREEQRQERERREREERRRRAREELSKSNPFGVLGGLAGLGDFEELSEQLKQSPSYLEGLHLAPIVTPPQTDYGAIRARREDELRATDDRARQQVEDYEAELGRLQQEHAEIVQPDARLWWGVGILGVFAILGVGLPTWIMSQGPDNLASVRWVFWPFAISLALLIGYIVIYLAKLTGNRNQADQDGARRSSALSTHRPGRLRIRRRSE
jgi:hypothetical protein